MEYDENNSMQLLYCDEDPFVSSPPPPSPTSASLQSQRFACAAVEDEQELDQIFVDYKVRERSYAPRSEYLEQLQESADVSRARSRGIQYIIYVFGRLGLAIATVFNAVNYLDRFLSMNCHVKWEVWMVELLSIACLSVACKLDEVNIPSLHHLQMEELKHSFQPTTIRDMELTLLKALQWRLACVTPYSFLQLFLCRTPNAAAGLSSRATHFLLRSLLDPSLLRFNASTVATSALRCVVHDGHHHDSCFVNRLIDPVCHSDNEDACLKIMEAHRMISDFDHDHQNQWSPVSVIPVQTDVINITVSRRLFGELQAREDTMHTDKRDEVIIN